MNGEATIEAWIWVEAEEGLVKREGKFFHFRPAKIWLSRQIAKNPEAYEYGIHDTRLNTAIFLSAAIQDRCQCDVVGRPVKEQTETPIFDSWTDETAQFIPRVQCYAYD